MEQTGKTAEKSSKKRKSLVAGRILSCVPLALIALLFLALSLPSASFFGSTSRSAQVWNTIMLTTGGILMALATIPSFACCAAGLALLISARKNGGGKTVPFIVLCALGMAFSALFSLFLFFFARGFESTVGQLDKLSKISEIEEFVLTDDSEEGGFHDGTMYNDLDLYLRGGGFLQVARLSEYLTSFHLEAAGEWNLFVVEDDGGQLTRQAWLEKSDLSALCGTKIKKLTDVISRYGTFMEKVEELPLLEENPTRAGIFKTPLQKEALALRENAIYEDVLEQDGVSAVKKITGQYDYLENYWYEITMSDGHTLLMTVSAVFPQEDGSVKSDFCIRMFDGEPISLLSMTNETYGINYYSPYTSRAFSKKIDAAMRSYRDFFPHYKEFLALAGDLLEESKKAEADKNRHRGGGMVSGTYSAK